RTVGGGRRHVGLGLGPLPAVFPPDGELLGRGPGRRDPRQIRSVGTGAGTSHEPPVRGLLRRSRAGRVPPHRRRQRFPSGRLRTLGIRNVVALPGVGTNLQDHLEVYIQYACTEPVTMQPYLSKWRQPFVGLEWILARKGPAATNHFEGGGFVRSNDEVAYPN